MNTSTQSGKSSCAVAVNVSFQKWVMTEQKWTKTCHWQRYGKIFS